MRIHAFSGLRYALPGDVGHLAGPPYDQIDESLRRQLQKEPHHFAHLIRPAGGADAHHTAAERHRTWLDRGVLVNDPVPSLYPYQIALVDGSRRLGVAALLGLEEESSPVVRPHEATVPKTVEERLGLLRATRVDLEPILVLADDDGALDDLLADDIAELPPLVRHEDSQGNLHHLYRLEDAGRIGAYQRALSRRCGLIADGHHRYTVARRYAAETGARNDSAAGSKLAVITSLASDGLTIDPIHRQLGHPAAIEDAASLAAQRHQLPNPNLRTILDSVATAAQPAVGITRDGMTELWQLDRSGATDKVPQHLQHLAVGWLHAAIFPALGLGGEAATDGTIRYRSNPEVLLHELDSGEASVAFWLPPMSGEDFARAMEGGQLLPPKSTRFLPKVASGLVWAGHDCRLLVGPDRDL